jgi:hypothetical protein
MSPRPTTFFRPIVEGGTFPPFSGGGGGSGGGTKPPPSGGPPKGAINGALITSTGGLQGSIGLLIVPYLVKATGRYVFGLFDTTNFNCEEDCIYDFKTEDVKAGRSIDVHKVYLQYKDIGRVKFTVFVKAIQYNRSTQKSTVVEKSKTVTVGGLVDLEIYSVFIDLKVQGERPRLRILRRANDGPLDIVTAMMIGNSAEEAQL